MEIFDFLFSNIAFLIAIVWFLASIFSNRQKQEQERNRNPRPVAKPIEDREPRAQSMEEPRPVSHPFETDNIPWETIHEEPVQDKVSQRTEELLAKAERIQNRERLQLPEKSNQHRDRLGTSPTPLAVQSHSSPGKKVIDLGNLNRQNVVQGMVWSQVFGLPRAKEPHRTWPRHVHSRQK